MTEFLFDFASPNTYLAHRVIPEIQSRTGAAFVYKPILLGGVFKLTANQSPAGIRPAGAMRPSREEGEGLGACAGPFSAPAALSTAPGRSPHAVS